MEITQIEREEKMDIREWWKKASLKERDAKIAKVIFGCKVGSRPIGGTGIFFTCECSQDRPHGCEFEDGERSQYLMCYSRDISAAFLVVEKMKEQGYAVLIHTHPDEIKEEYLRGWNVRIYRCGSQDDLGWIHGETPAEAICLAALLANEGRVEF